MQGVSRVRVPERPTGFCGMQVPRFPKAKRLAISKIEPGFSCLGLFGNVRPLNRLMQGQSQVVLPHHNKQKQLYYQLHAVNLLSC
jgi:hypothetical protein